MKLKKKFDGLLLVSDIDNTLMIKDFIPEENKKAIKYFTDNGGLFTIASGRNPVTAVSIAESVGVNAPLICVNGGMIYDKGSNKKLHNIFLTEKIDSYINILLDKFPNLCYGYTTDDGYYFNSLELFYERFDSSIITEYIKKGYYKEGRPIGCPKNISKIVIADNEEQINKIEQYGNSLNLSEVLFVKTATRFLEIIPKGVNKGIGVANLAHILNINNKNIFTIGDFDNDVEMLKNAEVSACPDNSPQRIKDLATIIVKSCEDGAVADFISYIDSLY